MKRIILILCLSFVWHTADAKCSMSGIWLTGNVKTIHKGSVIYLEFYSMSQAIAESLNNKYPIYLVSGNEKISLLLLETMKGGFYNTQVVLKPSKELTVGSTYQIQIDNLTKYEVSRYIYQNAQHLIKSLSLTVTNSVNEKNYTLLANPIIIKKTLVYYGCGPAKWIHFNVAKKDEPIGYVKAFVTNKTAGSTTTYVLAVENGIVKIGHGMCSGAFSFIDSDKYEIEFSIVDNTGNYGQKTSSLLFDPPTIANAEE